MRKTTSWTLIILAFVPLVVMPGTFADTIDGKVLIYRLVAFVVSVLLFAMAWGGDNDLPEKLKLLIRKPLFIVMTAGIISLAISTFFAYDRYLAFFGETGRGEGFLTLVTLYILYAYISLLFGKKEWNYFFVFTAISAIVLFIYQVIKLLQGVVRSGALLGNPIFLSAWYLFAALSCIYLISQVNDRGKRIAPIFGTIALIACSIGIMLARTRGTMAGIGVAVIVCAIIATVMGKNIKLWRYNLRAHGIAIITITICFSGIFFVTRGASVWQHVPGLDRLAESSVQNSAPRFIFVEISKEGFVKSSLGQKLVGWGWDNYKFLWTKNYNPALYQFDTSLADRAHNKLIDMLIMTGILGLIIYLVIWYFFFRQTKDILKKNAVLGFSLVFLGIAYFVHNLFAFDTPVVLFSFYVILAYLTQYEKDQ